LVRSALRFLFLLAGCVLAFMSLFSFITLLVLARNSDSWLSWIRSDLYSFVREAAPYGGWFGVGIAVLIAALSKRSG
tara:strand:- start:13 stop:243 length:231 start_codon:yes stop_codon:yes gene_type:complete